MAEEVTKQIIVNRPARDVYGLWADFENFPKFMHNIESVTRTGPGMTHWQMRGPLGSTLDWDAGVTRDDPARAIAWQSTGGDVDMAGQVTFTPRDDGTTEITLTMRYSPPGGKIGTAISRIINQDPEQLVDEDLRNFKLYAEGRQGAQDVH